MTLKKTFSTLLLAAILCAPFTVSAQVTIGSGEPPSEWSLLDLSNYGQEQPRALHLPRMTDGARDSLFLMPNLPLNYRDSARGLMIFNIDNECLEFWSGSRWVSLCESRIPPSPYLTAPAVMLFFSPAESNRPATVTTNVPAGWEVVSINQGGISPAWLSTAPAPPSAAQSDTTLLVSVTANGAVGNRTGTITLQAVGTTLTHTITVTQLGTGGLGSQLAFVGAFWRYDQFGERLIRMTSTNNAWTARASEPWIVLCDTVPSLPAPNVPFGTDTPPVLNGRSYLTGNTSAINFRIGLVDDGNAPDDKYATPRWGQVIVTHNNNQTVHVIWVRQGEAAWYVMSPDDTGNNRQIAHVRRWSPFNVTADFAAGAAAEGQAIPLPARTAVGGGTGGGRHTNYPSQSGAFFKWAGSEATAPDNRERVAWSPIGNNPTTFTWGAAHNDGNWASFVNSTYPAGRHEVCPPGFRRPTDGVTNEWVTTANQATLGLPHSEMRQSLWQNPGNEASPRNSVWGFYADGFFDRRVPVDAPGTSGAGTSAVDTGSANIAVQGRLFFNPYRGYHLFLPAPGHRDTDGALSNVGDQGNYWGSTAWSVSNGWDLRFNSGLSIVSGGGRTNGSSVRCVSE